MKTSLFQSCQDLLGDASRKSDAYGFSHCGSILAILLWLSVAAPLSTALADPNVGPFHIPTPSVRLAPAGQHGFPFMASAANLAAVGYVEQEFIVSGTANAYLPRAAMQIDGRWDSTPNPGVSAPYTTRILVRRPANRERFNGTVLVEWLNESGDLDAGYEWYFSHDEMVHEGYAFVGVTAQFVGVKQLLAWELGAGARYGSLFHPGESFAYDVFSQAGAVLAHPRQGDPRPLDNLTGHVKALLAAGFSQSGAWLTTYINAIHPQAGVYSGFLVHDSGFGTPLTLDTASFEGDPIPGNVPATPFIDTPYPMQLRTDLNAPAMILLTEFGLSDFGTGAGRSFHLQRDSRKIRILEIAGAAHNGTENLKELNADLVKSTGSSVDFDTCSGPPPTSNRIHAQAARGALNALRRWSNDEEEAPRSAPRIKLIVPHPADNFDVLVAFDRDPKTNLAKGGIRLPAVAVPIATNIGTRTDLDPQTLGPGLACGLVGATDQWNRDGDAWDGQAGLDPSPTPEPDLQLLYSSHQDYVDRVEDSASQAVDLGFMRSRDASAVVREARKAKVP